MPLDGTYQRLTTSSEEERSRFVRQWLRRLRLNLNHSSIQQERRRQSLAVLKAGASPFLII